MTGNSIGRIFRITTWGESHGPALGCVIDGCPAGIEIKRKHIRKELARDTPYPELSRRLEDNDFEILGGIFKDLTTGNPISIIIRNRNVRSGDYRDLKDTPRPGHADITYRQKFGHVDWRGGSRASGRTWAAVIAAGAVAKRICEMENISFKSKILEMDGKKLTRKNLKGEMATISESCKKEGDSSGGMIECRILDLPAGLGVPAFNKFNSDLGGAILSIPGIKSFEIGAGVKSASMRGSRFNDPIVQNDGKISYSTNNAGGVLGGITTGAEVVFRAAVKPTPSIISPQMTVNLSNMEETIIETKGRFDVNYTPRVLVIAEALSAIITADHLMLSGRVSPESTIGFDERPGFGSKSKGGN